MLIDRRVFRVGNDLSAAGGTAAEILVNVPSVAVDIDGNVSLRGSSQVQVLIDGRPSGLTGASQNAFLEQIPASSIDRVEIITNPSAKYDPGWNGGHPQHYSQEKQIARIPRSNPIHSEALETITTAQHP